MFKKLKLAIQGIAPLLMHNGRLSDPLDEHTIALAEVTAKRKKTQADHERMSELEWLGGIYANANQEPVVPAELLEACIRDGAKKVRKGKDATAGLLVEFDALLQYEGPDTVPQLIKDKRFTDRRGVRIGKNRIMRTRPRFDDWSFKTELSFNPEIINKRDLLKWVNDAGSLVGLGDYRPRFGRFNAKEAK